MSSEPFEPVRYAIRVMQTKGYFAKRTPTGFIDISVDVMEIFRLQEPYWKTLIAKHALADNPQRAEHVLTSFSQKEVMGGANKVLDAFSTHLDATRPSGGSPDWSQAGREWAECCYCDGRGIVSEVPVWVRNRAGDDERRFYSFACKCERGRFFAGVKIADDDMLRYAADRKQAEIDGHKAKLELYGIDPEADGRTRARQFRAAVRSMVDAVASGKVTAKLVQPILPRTVEEARLILADRKRKANPPERLNPERVALAVFANGDDRNEWE